MSIEERSHHFLAVVDRFGENAHDDRRLDRFEIQRFECQNDEVLGRVEGIIGTDPKICQVWVWPLEGRECLDISGSDVRDRIAAARAEVETRERAEFARLTAKYGAA